MKQSSAKDSKGSLVFVRNASATEEDKKRAVRLTSGQNSFASSYIIFKDNEIGGI